jgi:hypothetical protein
VRRPQPASQETLPLTAQAGTRTLRLQRRRGGRIRFHLCDLAPGIKGGGDARSLGSRRAGELAPGIKGGGDARSLGSRRAGESRVRDGREEASQRRTSEGLGMRWEGAGEERRIRFLNKARGAIWLSGGREMTVGAAALSLPLFFRCWPAAWT